LTCFCSAATCRASFAIFRSVGVVTVLELSSEVDVDGEVYLKRPSSNEPNWLSFLADGLADPGALARLRTSSVSAVLLLRVEQRVFAITFGYGRTMLEPEVLESRFGLIVVLNAVDPEKLRSVDARTLEEVSLQTRRQLSRGASILSFELDLNRDLLRGVAGQPSNSDLGYRLAGATALVVELKIAFEDLPTTCRRALRYFRKKTYRRRFPWVDHVRLISDPTEIDELDRALEQELAKQNYEILYLAAPEIIDYERVDHFRYSSDPSHRFYELDWEDYLSTIKRGVPTISRIKRESVGAYYSGSSEPDHRWSIYRCLVAEYRKSNTVRILSAGEWYGVENNFARKTLAEAKTYERTADPLPAALEEETEGAYNQRACGAVHEAVLMDTITFRATESQDRVEFCDILLRDRIVHVKRKYSSSTLSHLFMQGLVCGELLQTDAEFRRTVGEDITNRGPALDGVIPARGAFDPSNYEIAYVVIAKQPRGNRHYLPFSSQVSFTRAARLLTQRGYKVSLARVDEP
jgi:uncharacterized protein (TIGR04141 family)